MRTRAILPVHLYGLMCDMRALHALAGRHGLHVIEDAAHCLEGRREGLRPGTESDTGCFSFYATKNLTCGEGGAIVTDDDALAAQLRRLRLHGMTTAAADRYRDGYHHWDVLTPGWKYNMDNIHAAVLLPQLQRIEQGLQRRAQIASRYMAAIDHLPGVSYLATRPDSVHARHLFPIRVAAAARDAIVQALQAEGIGVGVNYRPVTSLTWFRQRFGHADDDFPEAARLGREVLSLPIYPLLRDDEVDRVVESLRHALAMRRSA